MGNRNADKPGYRQIFVASITLKNGKKLYASAYGLKAFAIWVKDGGDKSKS